LERACTFSFSAVCGLARRHMWILPRIAILAGTLTLCCAYPPARGADIVFAPEFTLNELYVMNVETGSVTKTSLGLAHIQELTYSQARKTLAFVASRTEDGPTHLFLLSWPGLRLQRVPDAPNHAHPYRPQFDPDGKNIYAVNYGPVIFRYSLEMHDWRKMSIEGVADPHIQGLAISPSSHLAAISPSDFKGFLIASTDSDHFTVDRLVLRDFDSCSSAHWLDETHIVFLGRKKPGRQFVWTLDLDTGTTQQLTHEPLGTRDFMSLSADGKHLVFTATDSDSPEWTIWSLSLDSTAAVKLLPGKKDDSYLFPTWLD
jgi:Tol biopolymer transport system component